MLSLGWSELGIIFIIIVVVVGPNEIPNLLKQFGKVTKKIKSISRDFNTSINNIVKEAEIRTRTPWAFENVEYVLETPHNNVYKSGVYVGRKVEDSIDEDYPEI